MARAGNALAVQGQIEAAMLRGGRAAQQQTRQLGLMDQQMRAIGTTIRYALAGTAVFGITSLISQLNQLQQQMGLIAAIGPTAGVTFNQSQLGSFLNELEQRTVGARTPLNEMNDAAINFLSTVQGAKRSEIPDIISQIGLTARLAQTPTEDLTKAVTTMNIAAGRANNLKNINALLREWFHLISTVPGGIAAAPQIAQQLGPLGAVARIPGARLSPEQLMGFATGALRFGATPSTALRGVQFFLQSVLAPTPGSQHAKALAAAGFTPRRLEAQGGARYIYDYLQYLKKLGARGARPGALRRFGAAVDVTPETDAALEPNLAVPGMSPRATRFLTATIGRIHGIRTAAVLLAQLDRQGTVSGLGDVMQDYHNLWLNHGKDVGKLSEAQQRYLDATPIQGAAIAFDTMRKQAAQALAPAINLVSRGVQHVQGAMVRHPDATQWAIRGGATALGLAGLFRLFGGRNILTRIPGLNRLGRMGGLGIPLAAQAMATGNPSVLGARPDNPMFVVVVGSLPGAMGAGGRGGGGGIPPGRAGPGLFGRRPTTVEEGAFRGPGTKVMRGAGALTALTVIDQLTGGHGLSAIERGINAIPQWGGKGHPLFDALRSKATSGADITSDEFRILQMGPKRGEQALRWKAQPGLTKLQREEFKAAGEKLLEATRKFDRDKRAVRVEGGVDLKITVDDGKKKKDARVHLPLSTQHEGGKVPTARGKRKSIRVDFTVGGTNIRDTERVG